MSVAKSLACSFYNPQNGDVVQLNQIHQDSEFNMSGSDEEDAAGSGIFNGEQATLDLYFYDSDAAIINQLQQWQDDQTPVRFAAAGTKSNILWNVDSTVILTKPKTFSTLTRRMYHVRITAKGARLPIWQGVNLIHGFVIVKGFDNGWADDSGNGVPNGYVESNSGIWSFANGELTLTGSGGNMLMQIGQPFPVGGVAFTFSFEVVTVGAEQNTQTRAFMQTFTSSTVKLEQKGNITTSGKRTLQFTTPESFYRFVFDLLSPGGADTGLTIKDPVVRVGTDDTYIKG